MKVHVLLSPLNADELYFSEKTTVVIDVLRASSTTIVALKNGAREVIPVDKMEFAMKISGGQNILGGERNSKKIEGFDLGNSPLEYTPEVVEGKAIIQYTTNGSKAVVRAKFSKHLFVASFLNLGAIADKLTELGDDVQILCAGSGGMFSLEDTVCAGMLIKRLKAKNDDLEFSDAAVASVILADSFEHDILGMLKNSEHGKELLENGFEEDLELIAKIDSVPIVPYFESDSIKIEAEEKEEQESDEDKS
jgi:2-phosphosulfolactate phosphatase